MVTANVSAIGKTTDLVATRSWYESAGFRVRASSPSIDPTWIEVERDGLVLQFVSGDTPWSGTPAFTGSFYVHVDDVNRVAGELEGRVTCEWGVEERTWGSLELTLQDPNGYFITFTQPA